METRGPRRARPCFRRHTLKQPLSAHRKCSWVLQHAEGVEVAQVCAPHRHPTAALACDVAAIGDAAAPRSRRCVRTRQAHGRGNVSGTWHTSNFFALALKTHVRCTLVTVAMAPQRAVCLVPRRAAAAQTKQYNFTTDCQLAVTSGCLRAPYSSRVPVRYTVPGCVLGRQGG